jgi:hypothetical protein
VKPMISGKAGGFFVFPPWDSAWMMPQSGRREFGRTIRAYQKLHSREATAQPSVAGPVNLLRRLLAEQEGISQGRGRQQSLDNELTLQAQLHVEKLEAAARCYEAREKAFVERDRERELRQLEREAVRLRVEAQRNKRRQEQARAKEERHAEKERIRAARELGNESRRIWQQRSTVADETLPATKLPAGAVCRKVGGDTLSPGELLMAWNFLCAHSDALVCPSLPLDALRIGLLVKERALDLTDIHVALLRVLFVDMDANHDVQMEPPRASLLSTLTWPYMACMYIEENAHRFSGAEDELAAELGTTEYYDVSPAKKLQLLTFLCNECSGCEPIKSRLDDVKATNLHWKRGYRDRKMKAKSDAQSSADARLERAAEKSIAKTQLLGLDRWRNRFLKLLDENGDVLVAVHIMHSSLFETYSHLSARDCVPDASTITLTTGLDEDAESPIVTAAVSASTDSHSTAHSTAGDAVKAASQPSASALSMDSSKPNHAAEYTVQQSMSGHGLPPNGSAPAIDNMQVATSESTDEETWYIYTTAQQV